jgi:hypothetical protein
MCWFNRKGPSGFSGASTAEEVTAGIDARGLVAVITGEGACREDARTDKKTNRRRAKKN